jgi:PAS domain S-box-containing protein
MSNAFERRSTYRRTEDIYRKAIEDIRDYAIFLVDVDGIVTNWNVGAQHILGYTEAEIVGKDASKFFTWEDRVKGVPAKELSEAAMLGRAEDERWHVRRNGSRFWASGIVTPVRDQTGQLIGFSKVMRDMTERNKLTQERDRFFAFSIDMLCIVHLDGRFQRVNPAFQEVLGFSCIRMIVLRLSPNTSDFPPASRSRSWKTACARKTKRTGGWHGVISRCRRMGSLLVLAATRPSCGRSMKCCVCERRNSKMRTV